MTLFRYKALTAQGGIKKGYCRASSTNEFKIRIQCDSLSLISYSRDLSGLYFRKVKNRDLLHLCQHLEQFDQAGLPLRVSFHELVHSTTSQKLKYCVQEIMNDIECGVQLSVSLSKYPNIFDSVFVGLIAVGEKTGNFSFALRQLSHHIKWVENIKDQTFKALRYPMLMSGILVLLIGVLLQILVPELTQLIKTLNIDLPFSTKLLILISVFILDNGLILSILLSLVSFAICIAIKFHPSGFLIKDKIYSSLPVIGLLRNKIVLARFCHVFSVLFESGIDILSALELSRKSLQKGKVSIALERVEALIREGKSLSQSFEQVDCFPQIIIHMVKLGEKTSGLNASLKHVAEYLETTLKRDVDAAISLIEPMLIILVGVIMTWIILSTFIPIYDALKLMEY